MDLKFKHLGKIRIFRQSGFPKRYTSSTLHCSPYFQRGNLFILFFLFFFSGVLFELSVWVYCLIISRLHDCMTYSSKQAAKKESVHLKTVSMSSWWWRLNSGWDSTPKVLLMEKILHQLIDTSSHCWLLFFTSQVVSRNSEPSTVLPKHLWYLVMSNFSDCELGIIKKPNWSDDLSRRIHVRYIYLHLVESYGAANVGNPTLNLWPMMYKFTEPRSSPRDSDDTSDSSFGCLACRHPRTRSESGSKFKMIIHSWWIKGNPLSTWITETLDTIHISWCWSSSIKSTTIPVVLVAIFIWAMETRPLHQMKSWLVTTDSCNEWYVSLLSHAICELLRN